MKEETGILLLNLGTPSEQNTYSVRAYLKEFLNDPRVIELPRVIRWLLVNAFIIPFRVKKSLQAYKSIWQQEGSPLLINSLLLKSALSRKLGKNYQVSLGMRYGNPRIEDALEELKACDSIVILPLFPQYASAVTGSALEKTLRILAGWKRIPSISIKNSFYDDLGFIQAYASLIQKTTENKQIDLFLFSYHGLPERQIDSAHCLVQCDRSSACPIQNKSRLDCYRAQCYITSYHLAKSLGLEEQQYVTTFQSRLGWTPWIKPYTDHLLPSLISRGVKNIAVACPSFVADCLETLEEINIRMKKQWEKLGGGEFMMVPCLNAAPVWVEALAKSFKLGINN